MGPGEALVGLAVVVLLIVAVALVYASVGRRLKHRERMAQIDAESGGGGDARKLAELEQRVRVLERIATEGGRIATADLAAQIEDLRRSERVAGEPA